MGRQLLRITQQVQQPRQGHQRGHGGQQNHPRNQPRLKVGILRQHERPGAGRQAEYLVCQHPGQRRLPHQLQAHQWSRAGLRTRTLSARNAPCNTKAARRGGKHQHVKKMQHRLGQPQPAHSSASPRQHRNGQRVHEECQGWAGVFAGSAAPTKSRNKKVPPAQPFSASACPEIECRESNVTSLAYSS